jgi:hypothetical protein
MGLTTLAHQLLRQPQAAVRPHHGQGGDVAVRDAVGGLFLHLGEHVADDLGGIVGCLWWAGNLFWSVTLKIFES